MIDRPRRDQGAVLPLVLVFVVTLSLVIAGTARYTATNLRYSQVVKERSSASASAEAALRYAIQRVRSNAVTTCDSGPVTIAPTHDAVADPILADADAIDITCTRLDGGQATLSDWAAVVTGVGISGSSTDLLITENGDHAATGRIFVSSLRQSDFRINIEDVEFAGNMFYDGSSDDCTTIDRYVESSSSYDDDIVLTTGAFVCWPQTWDEIVDEPPIGTLPAVSATSPPWSMVGTCRVFDPGWYVDLDLLAGGHNYFRSGEYVFEDVDIDTATSTGTPETVITGGFPADASFANRLVTSGPCDGVQADDGLTGPHGVTWYLGGTSRLEIRKHATIELLPMLHSDGTREHAVSIHVLGAGSVLPETLADGVEVIDDSDEVAWPHNHALFQGQIWSPTQAVDLEDSLGDPNGQITSGVVAAQLLSASTFDPVGALGPDRTAADHELLLTASATVDGVTATVRAVVEHRPGATVGDRVAVRSFRFVD